MQGHLDPEDRRIRFSVRVDSGKDAIKQDIYTVCRELVYRYAFDPFYCFRQFVRWTTLTSYSSLRAQIRAEPSPGGRHPC